jgi:hypothetical protein
MKNMDLLDDIIKGAAASLKYTIESFVPGMN